MIIVPISITNILLPLYLKYYYLLIAFLGEPQSLTCYPLVVPVCQNIGYNYTVLNTEMQIAYIAYVNQKLSEVKQDNMTVCSLSRKRLLCTDYFPVCIDKTVASYCRDKCEEFFEKNCSAPLDYQKHKCMEFPMGNSPVDICKRLHWPRAQNWLEARTPPTAPRPSGKGTRLTSIQLNITYVSRQHPFF
jgi:hypothetical protein